MSVSSFMMRDTADSLFYCELLWSTWRRRSFHLVCVHNHCQTAVTRWQRCYFGQTPEPLLFSEEISLWNLTLNLPKKSPNFLVCALKVAASFVVVLSGSDSLKWKSFTFSDQPERVPCSHRRGSCGPAAESRVWARHATWEAEILLRKDQGRRHSADYQGGGFLNTSPKYCPFIVSYILKLLQSWGQCHTPIRVSSVWMVLKRILKSNGRVKSRLFGMTYYFDEAGPSLTLHHSFMSVLHSPWLKLPGESNKSKSVLWLQPLWIRKTAETQETEGWLSHADMFSIQTASCDNCSGLRPSKCFGSVTCSFDLQKYWNEEMW